MFGERVNNMTIGTRKDVKIPQSMGPCDYSPDRSVALVRPSSQTVNFTNCTSRMSLIASPELGPGAYDNMHKEFGKQLQKVTIGVKRDFRSPEGPGPGQYSPEKGDSITKHSSAITEFHRRVGRVSAQIDPKNGPGSFYDDRKFGADGKLVTIGERRSDKKPEGPGPADYSPDRSMTKSKSAAYIFHKNQGRTDYESPSDPNGGPGTYNI